MARTQIPLLEKVTITDIGSEGKAVARVNDLVVFVPFGVPGDVVDLKVYSRKKNFCEAKIVKFHQSSPFRIQPFCSHFGICGGCKWQVLPYNEQLVYKQKQVYDAFTRIGKFPFPELQPILPSPQSDYYRNKLEFTFSSRRWYTEGEDRNGDEDSNALGFHIPQLFDRVLDINHCYLQPGLSNEIRLAVKQYALERKLEFYDHRIQSGFLRNLIVRNTLNGEFMVIVVFGWDDGDAIGSMLSYIENRFPQLASLMYVINGKRNDTISDLEIRLWSGKPYLTEEMDPPLKGGATLRFKVGPVSFFQTNPAQAWHLYKTAFDFAGLTGTEIVYDLYCGTGTISNIVASSALKVVGVEYVESAVDDARINSQLNSIGNTTYVAGDLMRILTSQFIIENGKPDVIITDPPRSGMHDKVVARILESAPEKVVYVSCNPATQARDIALMADLYSVEAVQPVDMFPQTHHVENVALLVRKDALRFL